MKIHLVGGFLGSGKTTAITHASKILSDKNIITAVVTNDQGNYLVDSRFIEISKIPIGEVKGGCFCCNYDQLDTQINVLKSNHNPSVIFAETVGSCTDLVATVLKPLLKFRESDIEQVTFSSFVDSRLLLNYLQETFLPFSEEINYIWEKQVEEAQILIVNKVDLLSAEEFKTLELLVEKSFPTKHLLFQNSLDQDSINTWIEKLNKFNGNINLNTIEIDYDKYGAGEANLAWLDEEIEIVSTNNTAVEVVYEFLNKLSGEVMKRKLPVGHLKFYVSYNNQAKKISVTSSSTKSVQIPIPLEKSNSAYILLNARIQTSPDTLRELVSGILSEFKNNQEIIVSEKNISSFHPSYPNPTHRLTT